MAAIAILMPPSGAVLAVAASFVQMLRLVMTDDLYMADPAASLHWQQGIVAEIFYVLMTGCFAVLAWRYNATLLIQALLVCFGLSLVARAFMTKGS